MEFRFLAAKRFTGNPAELITGFIEWVTRSEGVEIE
jgi:hypothetical protein